MRRIVGKALSRVLQAYYLGPDHPMKLRLWWGLRKFFDFPRLTVPYVGRGWITVDERDILQAEIFVTGSYEPEVWEALFRFAMEDEVLWDIGANIGSFSIRSILDERVAQVHAFEPDPNSAAILRHNFGLNPGAAVLHEMALSSVAETRTLHRGPDANSGLTGFENRNSQQSFEVACNVADDLVFGQGLPAPTLVKIDVEGWELEVLRGMGRLLMEKPPRAIVLEAENDSNGEITSGELLSFLREHGYSVSRVSRPSEIMDERENYLAVHNSVGGGT